MNDTPTFVSLAAFARLCGVSAPCVTGWRRRGHVVMVDGKVDVARQQRETGGAADGSSWRHRQGEADGRGARGRRRSCELDAGARRSGSLRFRERGWRR